MEVLKYLKASKKRAPLDPLPILLTNDVPFFAEVEEDLQGFSMVPLGSSALTNATLTLTPLRVLQDAVEASTWPVSWRHGKGQT